MNHRLLWQAPDGQLKITIPVEAPLPGEVTALYLDRIALTARSTDPGLAACTYLAALDASALPISRRFRACWRFHEGSVHVDLGSARQQRLAELREERNHRLQATDAAYLRARETDDREHQARLSVYRQRLRDLPAVAARELAALHTAAELEAYQPAWPSPPRE